VDVFAAALAPWRWVDRPPGAFPPRTVVCITDRLEFAVAYFGCLRAGFVAVPVDPRATGTQLRRIVRDSAAAAVAVDSGLRGTGLPVRAYPVPGGERPAVLLYPPGGGGAAILPHRALLAHHEQLSRVEPPLVAGDDTVLVAAPLSRAYGLNCGLGAVVYHGACGVLAADGDPARVGALVARHHVTTVLGAPALYAGWARLPDLAATLETVRVAACGPAQPAPPVAARFRDRTGHMIFAGYGLPEASPVLTTTFVGGEPARRGTRIGHPVPGVQLRLRYPDGRAVPVAPHPDTGEDGAGAGAGGGIEVRGPNLFTGYGPDGRGGPDADGWWATGDRGFTDDEGALYLESRAGAGPGADEGA
ncbi:MAG TPA: AMP-binding protein, partial [Pilimelia sp.]|nr:AMP-binding protein [Pilimelia sp.]